MFCPKCGGEASESQKFCKSCGTNLQVVGEALTNADDTLGQLRLDLDEIVKNVKDQFSTIKAGHFGSPRTSRIERRLQRNQLERVPKSKEWMSYSWQHNLRNGLMRLLSGTGLGVFLYYVSKVAVEQGLAKSIEAATQGHVQGLDAFFHIIWMVALIPVLAGLGQIIYAAFFAESMQTLSDRFLPQPVQLPVAQPEEAPALNAPPASVTERTTHFFEERQPVRPRDTQ